MKEATIQGACACNPCTCNPCQCGSGNTTNSACHCGPNCNCGPGCNCNGSCACTQTQAQA